MVDGDHGGQCGDETVPWCSCTTLADALETVGGLVQCVNYVSINPSPKKKIGRKRWKTCLINSVYH